MASYADQRNALFGAKGDGKKASAAPSKQGAPPSNRAKAPLSLGGPSAAAVARKREQQAGLRSKGDGLFAEAEALMPPKKSGFAALMAKKPSPLFAAPKYAAAANAYASAGAAAEAVLAFEKAAMCHEAPEVGAHHTAASEYEKASKLAPDEASKAALGGRAAAAWVEAGEALRAAEAALRCATETMDQAGAPTRAAMDLVAAALDYADAASGKACQPDVSKKALLWYARRGLLDDAIATAPKHVKALADAGMDPGPTLYRSLAALVVMHLANRADVAAADAAFMTALGHEGFARSSQAKAAEDLLVAFKPERAPDDPDADLFADALASTALQTLDVDVATLAKRLPRPPAAAPNQAAKAAPPAPAPEDLPPPPDEGDDDDDLPDLT